MDIFCEQIVVKKKTVKDRVAQLGIILAALLLVEVFFILNSFLLGFGFLLCAGVIYGAFILIKRTNVEYEYILTNSILDIDKIYAKSSRKRMLSVDFKNVEVFGKVNEAGNQQIKEFDYSGDIEADDVYYFELFKDNEKQRVYFRPNNRILSGLHSVAPRLVPEPKGE